MIRFSSLVVGVAGLMVPAELRAEWRREWLAELHAGHTGSRRRGTLRFALGALRHAVWLRAQQWRWSSIASDLKFGWRFLWRRPTFALSAVITLALGIGATTATFSVVYGVLLKPLPYRDPDRLVQLWEVNPLFNWTEATIAPGNLLSWRERNQVFSDIAWYSGSATRQGGLISLTIGGEEPRRVQALRVSTNFFDVLGVPPALGRTFVAGEDEEARARVVVLSDAFRRRHFGANIDPVGQMISLNNRPFQVIGVMPPMFTFDRPETDFWVPVAMALAQQREVRRPHFLRAVARLKPGASIQDARAELSAIARDLEREYPDTNRQMGVGLGPLDDWFVGRTRQSLLIFLAAVGLVLLIACANVANLLLARTTERLREMTLRAALGASRLRLTRQLLLESLIVAALGTLIGVGLALTGVHLLVDQAPVGLPRQQEIGLHSAVLAFAVALTLITTLVVGILPAMQATRTDLRDRLGEGARTTHVRGKHSRRLLVAVQVALAVMLVAGALLTTRSFRALNRVDPGFAVEGLVTARLSLPAARYGTDGKPSAFFEEVCGRLKALPGVTGAGATIRLPLEGSAWTGDLFIEGRPQLRYRELRHKSITPGYHEAIGLRLLFGRSIETTDRAGAPLVVVVNQTLAERFFPGQDPVGTRIAFDQPTAKVRWRTIVGVVSDEVQDGLGVPPVPEVYDSEGQEEWLTMAIALRGSASPSQLIAGLRQTVREMDAQLALYDVAPFVERVSRSVLRERVAVWLTTVFGIVALVLSAVGIYGVAAYSVTSRTREIGVRIACGATGSNVVGMIVREYLGLVIAGLVVGLTAALLAGKFVESLLYGVKPTDAVSLGGGVALLLVPALIACLIPARRALRIDPAVVLKAEP